MPVKDRFSSKVEKTDDCWVWRSSHDRKGYGWFCVNGRMKRAHRIAYELCIGPIPSGYCVLHRCDNPACVRPSHLFLGTVAENNHDRHAKGRSRHLFPPGDANPNRQRAGERHWSARLTDADIIEIRRRRANGETTRVLGAAFGVNSGTISRIARRLWRAVVSA